MLFSLVKLRMGHHLGMIKFSRCSINNFNLLFVLFFRILESFGRFLDNVDIDMTNSSNITIFSYKTFAFQVQNIDISRVTEQTLSAKLGSVEHAKTITGDIDSDLITHKNDDNATATIQITKQLLEYCSLGIINQRLSFSLFLFDSFFQSRDPNMTIGSLIVAARLKCASNTSLPPINITLLSSEEVRLSYNHL